MRKESPIANPASNETYESIGLDRFTALMTQCRIASALMRSLPSSYFAPQTPRVGEEERQRYGKFPLLPWGRRLPEGSDEGSASEFSKILESTNEKACRGRRCGRLSKFRTATGRRSVAALVQTLREERRPEARSGREEVPRFNDFNIAIGQGDRQRFCCIAAMQMLQCSKKFGFRAGAFHPAHTPPRGARISRMPH